MTAGLSRQTVEDRGEHGARHSDIRKRAVPLVPLIEMQVLTREETQRFLIQAKVERYFELFLLELTTGLRRGELLALQWNDLNLETEDCRSPSRSIRQRRTVF